MQEKALNFKHFFEKEGDDELKFRFEYKLSDF